MAELKLNPEEGDIVETNLVKRGALELTDQEISIFEGPNWKIFLSAICYKFLENFKEIIYGECNICFFPYEKEDFNKMMTEQNTTLMGKSMVKPLFCVKFDRDKNIEHMDKSDCKIPRDIIYIILCK